jgi:hypothetical protein
LTLHGKGEAMKSPILIIFLAVPEAMLVTGLASSLLGLKNFKRICLIAVLVGLVSTLLRIFVVYEIIRTLTVIGVMMLLMTLGKMSSLWKAFVSTISAITIYLVIEYLCVFVILSFMDITVTELAANPLTRLLYSLPQFFIATVIIIMVYRYKLQLFHYRIDIQ